MAFKIIDLDKFLKEDYEEDEPVEGMEGAEEQLTSLADMPDDIDDEDAAVPMTDVGFEMESDGNDGYFITYDGKPICSVFITCKGQPADMTTVENPSDCVATIGGVVDELKSEEYLKKLEEMGFKVEGEIVADHLGEELPEELPESAMVDRGNKYLED